MKTYTMTNSSLSKSIKTLLWGNSVALAWTWGIGLFFAVQVAVQFGFDALVKFATIDAIGLTLFGVVNDQIANKYNSAEEFEASFINKAENFKFGLLFYQFLAISLTLYCCMKYVTLPLGILSILVAGVFIGATIFLGEEFSISKIKFSHAGFGIIILASLLVLINSELFASESIFKAALSSNLSGLKAELDISHGFLTWIEQAQNYTPLYSFKSPVYYWSFGIPLVVGFLCGPWLDLQNWQRVVQIRKEGLSCTPAYIIAGIIFWTILIIDGSLAISCFQYARENLPSITQSLSSLDPNSFFYSVKNIITVTLASSENFEHLLGFYMIFVGLAALATFDSAYIAYKWYTQSLIKDNNNIIFSFVPPWLIASPIPGFFACIVTATVTMHFSEFGKFISQFDSSLEKFFRIELEYYLAFYAAFFIIYAVSLYRNMQDTKAGKSFSALKLFSIALSSIAIFGIGYFTENTIVMAVGSLLPFIYGWFTVSKEEGYKPELSSKKPDAPQLTGGSERLLESNEFRSAEVLSAATGFLPKGAKATELKGCYLNDGWFCHQFIPTYQDTNSVGNVYFAMYLLWVGKTRELFFAHVMPGFDPNNTDYYILTRNIEHKFQKEIREFDEVTICVRVSDFNRKFVTMEHQILDKEGATVGKGKQTLMFVDSEKYGLVDIPAIVKNSFIPFVKIETSK